MLLLFVTIIFACIPFISPQFESSSNVFFLYYFNELKFILGNIPYFFLLFFVTSLVFTRAEKLKQHRLHKKYLISLRHVLKVFVLGFFMSGFLIFTIAALEVNIFSLMTRINPGLAGIQSDIQTINKELASLSGPPVIIDATKSPGKISLTAALGAAGNENFFGKNILPSVSSLVIIPPKKIDGDIILVNNFLAVQNLEEKSLEAISPILGNLFVRGYFSDKNIKRYPKVSILTKSEYLKHRKIDSEKKISSIEKTLEDIEGGIASFSAGIENNKTKVIDDLSLLETSIQQRDTAYRRCIAARRPRNECQTERSQQDAEITVMKQNINDTNVQILFLQEQLAQYEYYEKLFEEQKEALKFSENNIQHELGVFEPKDSISLALDKSKEKALEEYLVTLVHEYIHYSSYISENQRFETAFFEEGLTEYFVRQIISGTEFKSNGYPFQVKVISEMMNKIAESDFSDIYFNKDQTALEKIMNLVYGDNFYENNIFLFEALHYTTDFKKSLELANNIMKKINGDTLNEEDFRINFITND